jgi:cell division protein FtsB
MIFHPRNVRGRWVLFSAKVSTATRGARLDSGYWFGRVTMAAVVLLAGCFAVRLASGSNGWASYQSKKTENVRLQQQVEQLQKENEDLEKHINALKHDSAAIEKEAREQLGLARPGETVYVLQQRRPILTAPAPTNATSAKR